MLSSYLLREGHDYTQAHKSGPIKSLGLADPTIDLPDTHSKNRCPILCDFRRMVLAPSAARGFLSGDMKFSDKIKSENAGKCGDGRDVPDLFSVS